MKAAVFAIEAVRNMNAGAGHEDTPLLEMALKEMKPLTKGVSNVHRNEDGDYNTDQIVSVRYGDCECGDIVACVK
jgi:hypothetical protein